MSNYLISFKRAALRIVALLLQNMPYYSKGSGRLPGVSVSNSKG